jgi:hypothetical protein
MRIAVIVTRGPKPHRTATERAFRTTALFVAAGIAVVVVLSLVTGCGASWSTVARTSIDAAAVAVDAEDTALAAAIRRDCQHDGLDACLDAHGYTKALKAVATADSALRAAQAAVDVAERAGASARWDAIAPRLTVAWCELEATLAGVGVYVPRELVVPLNALVAVAGTCRPPVTNTP